MTINPDGDHRMLLVAVGLRAKRGLQARAREQRRMTTLVLWWGVLLIAVFVAGTGMAAVPRSGAAGVKAPAATSKTHRVAHSPYALAAGAHSAAPGPNSPIKGHSATMVQGLGTSAVRRHTLSRPH